MKQIGTVFALTALLAACSAEPTAMRSARTMDPAGIEGTRGLDASVERDLATLRRVTAPFHDFATARAAGWSAQITPCMDMPTGGMGFHYGNPTYIDGAVSVDKPELLLYEPEKNGQMRLVAVEYIVPFTEWSAPQPPRLFGLDFKPNDTFQVWALHAWVWKHNPSGMFADWNPEVSCAGAAPASAAAQ